MQFATMGKYKKLLVLTGATKEKDINSIAQDIQPDYYVESLGKLRQVIKSKLGM